MTYDPIEEVRVVYTNPTSLPAPARSGPQAHIDHALTQALELAEQAQEMAEEAVAWLETITPSKNRNVALAVGQLVIEVKDTIRLKQ